MKTRRDFIKISALGLGATAVAAGSANALFGSPLFGRKSGKTESETPLRRTPTYCEICFWQCAGWVYKDEAGNIKKIIGNDEDQHCNGRFCPRGTGGVGQYLDEDRLKSPLIRTKVDGKDTFKEASWDEALDFIAKKMNQIKRDHGPECVALFTHGSGGAHIGHMLKAFGSGTIAAPSFAQCRGPREVGFLTTFGDIIYSPERIDIRDTRCMVLIGSHLGENMHNGQVQEMSDAIDKGATIITVDPRFSTAASKSKFWLPIKPATDLALLLSWINVLIENGWYDKEYVEKHTVGFDALKEHVKTFTPEWAFGITTIDPNIIRETAREMFNASPSVIINPGRHVTWYGDDTQRMRAVAILTALLGSWGRRGGFYKPEKLHLPTFPTPEFPEPKRKPTEAYKGAYPLANEVVANGLCDATIPSVDRECNLRAWIVNGTNLLAAFPNQKNTLEAIHALELLVVVDTMPIELTGYADVVLPECTYLERYDMIRNSGHRQPNIALRMPAAEPKYNTKPASWIAKELAGKLGLAAYFPWKDMEELLDWQFKQLGTSLEEMKRIGVKNFPRETDDLYFAPGEDVVFNTTSGKIELYSSDMESQGFDPMPVYTPHEEPPEGFYRLNYGRAPMHTFSRTANNPNLTALMSENVLWVNPKVAKLWNLKPEQRVKLKNQDDVVSTFSIKVRVTERIRWDSVYMVHGFGHNNTKLTRAHGHGINDTELITRVKIDPVMGGTGMRGNFVTFITEFNEDGKEAKA